MNITAEQIAAARTYFHERIDAICDQGELSFSDVRDVEELPDDDGCGYVHRRILPSGRLTITWGAQADAYRTEQEE